MYETTVQETICIAHRVSTPDGGPGPLHGHNWDVELTVGGRELDGRGLLLDPSELEATLHAIVDPLDHQTLDELPQLDGLPVTAQAMARWIADGVQPLLPESLVLLRIRIADGALRTASWRPEPT